jgi:hypothetical protein
MDAGKTPERTGRLDGALGDHAETISSTLDKNRRLHAVAAVATSISVLFAALALGLSAYTYYEGSKRDADIAASEALMRHFNYAASQGHPLAGKKSNASSSSPKKYDSVVAHAIYTANTIIDVTETTDERPAWRKTVKRMLLAHYKGDISENIRCNELDSRFIALLENHFIDKARCPPTVWERWWQWWEERTGRGQ